MTQTQTAKHTPGPWEVEPRGNLRARQYISAGEFRIIECLTRDQEANARLIAAAPETAAERDRLKALNAELLAALKACEEYMTACGYFAPKKDLAKQVRVAIAKAEER